jgi:iron complex transport system substrate-binding protein
MDKLQELKESMEKAGISIAYFDVSDFQSFCRVFKIFTYLTNRNDLYEKHVVEQKEKIDDIIARNKKRPPQTVLVLRASASSIRAKNSTGTMLGGMLYDFGCINIADSHSMLLDNLSIESISIQNPDKIFFVETGDNPEEIKESIKEMFSSNPLWSELSAVKSSNVYYMEKRLYNLKPNARFSEAYEKLEKILYE